MKAVRVSLSLKPSFTKALGILLFVILACPFIPVLTHTAFSQSKTLDDIRNRITGKGEILQVDFRTLFMDSFTGDYSQIRGRAWIGHNRYKIETGERLLLVEDSVSTLWDPTQNRVVLSDYLPEEDDFAPARLLASERDDLRIEEISVRDPLPGNATLLEFGYSSQELSNLNLAFVSPDIPRNSTLIRFTSEDPYATLVELVLVADNLQKPQFIRAVDQVDNVIHTQFTAVNWFDEGKTNGLSANLSAIFTFELPDEAEVIDLRKP